MGRVIGGGLVAVVLGVFTVAAAQLPPEIMADRYLLQVERLIGEKDHAGALEVMNKIIALQQEHHLSLPDEFHFKYAQIAFSAGSIKVAIDSVNKYLATAGRAGQFYREALELLDEAEQKQAELERIQDATETQRCWESPSVFCVSRLIVDRAMSYPESTSSQSSAADALFRVASAQVKSGAWEDASRTLVNAANFVSNKARKIISRPFWRGSKLEYPAAIELVKAELAFLSNAAQSTQPMQGAAELAEVAVSIEDLEDRVRVLISFASTLREAGHIEDSRAIIEWAVKDVEAIVDPNDKAEWFASIASAQSRAGFADVSRATFDRAVEAAEAIVDRKDKANRLASIAVAQSHAGFTDASGATFGRAVNAAESIVDLYGEANRLASIAAAQAGIGDHGAARGTIQAAATAVALRDILNLTHSYTSIASAQFEAGDIEGGRMSLGQATKAADSIENPNSRTARLKGIVSAGAMAGMFTEATSAAMLIDDPEGRGSALAKVALARAEAAVAEKFRTTIDMALESVKQMDHPIERGHALGDIAVAQAKTGDIGGYLAAIELALEPIKQIEDPYERGHVLADISVVQAKTGHAEDARASINSALEAVEAIESASNRSIVLGTVAEAQALAGNREESEATGERALKFALSVKDDNQRTARLRQSVTSRVETGQFVEAVKVAELIKDARQQANALAEVALAQMEANDRANARETIALAAEAAKTGGDYAYDLADIATVQAKAGMVKEAEATIAGAFKDIDSRLYWFPGAILGRVAAAQVKSGDVKGSRTTIDKALDALNTGWAEERANVLGSIAEVQLEIGDVEVAKETLTKAVMSSPSTEDLDVRLNLLGYIARLQIAAGDIERARVTIDTAMAHIRSINDAKLLEDIAGSPLVQGYVVGLMEPDQVDEVFKIINSLEFKGASRFSKKSFIYVVLRACALGTNPSNSRLVAAAITRASSRVHDELKKDHLSRSEKDNILQLLAESHASAHQFNNALDTAKMIEDTSDRIEVFAEIALAQKKAGNVEEARTTLGMAGKVAREMNDDTDSWALIDLGAAQIETGLVGDARTNFSRALKTAKSEDAWFQIISLTRLFNILLWIDDSLNP